MTHRPQNPHLLSTGLALVTVLVSLCAWPVAGSDAAPVFQSPSIATPERSDEGGRRVTVERRALVMGTHLVMNVEATDRSAALAASEAVLDALEAAEARLSTWTAASDLARFLRAPLAETVELDPRLHRDLAAALRCHEDTDGAFDPTVGPLVAAWDLRGAGRVPSDDEIDAALAAIGVDGLRLIDDRHAIRRHPRLSIDEGGFGKGAGLADALAALTDLADDPRFAGVRARLDLGGQLAFYGDGPWTVDVARPGERGRTVARFRIDGGSVATTGHSQRPGHVLDPRSGRPAADFGSLTVWARDPLLADCLSTGLYVLGKDAALAWAESHRGVEVLVAEHGADLVRASSGLPEVATHPSAASHPSEASHASSKFPNPTNPTDTTNPTNTTNTKGDGPSHPRSGPSPF